VFVRYFLGDLIRVLSTRDPDLGIDLPQIVVESRADDLIDLSSMVWLTERSLWQAIGHLDIPLTAWVARKEIHSSEGPVVHLYIENVPGRPEALAEALHGSLIDIMEDYRTYFGITGRNPVRVSELASGTFKGYLEAKRAEGAELGHLKPPRMQPSEPVLARLLSISAENGGERIGL